MEVAASTAENPENSFKVRPGAGLLILNGKAAAAGQTGDLAVLPLPNCKRVIRLDWAGACWAWAAYEQRVGPGTALAVLKLETKEKAVQGLAVSYICEFKAGLWDADCSGSSDDKNGIVTMVATVQSGGENRSLVQFFNLPLALLPSSSVSGTIARLELSEIRSYTLPGKMERLAWNRQDTRRMALADSNFSIYVMDTEAGLFLRVYHHAHTMEISQLVWINNEFEGDPAKSFVASCSHDGNIKFWDPEDPFAPCFVHSTGQVMTRLKCNQGSRDGCTT